MTSRDVVVLIHIQAGFLVCFLVYSDVSGKRELELAQKRNFYIIMGNREKIDQQAIAFNQGGSLFILY
jgi:hypothetical protein